MNVSYELREKFGFGQVRGGRFTELFAVATAKTRDAKIP